MWYISKSQKIYSFFSVAHRLSSIRSVNQIYVLVNGEIAEQGLFFFFL